MEYFLSEKGHETALEEIEKKFATRKTGQDSEAFTYFKNYDPTDWKIKGRAAQIAPWWNSEQAGLCTYVRIGTNIHGTLWSMSLFAYHRGSNVLLYTHIVENVD